MTDTQLIVEFFRNETPSRQLNREDLDKPTAESVIELYYYLCDSIFILKETTSEINDPTKSQQFVGRPIMIIRTLQYLEPFLNELFVNTNPFSISDLIMPISSRTKFFLANLIRFYYFQQERISQVEAVTNEQDEHLRGIENEQAFLQTTENSLKEEQENQKMLERKHIELLGDLENKKNDLKLLMEAKEEKFKKYEEEMKRLEEQYEKIVEYEKKLSDLQSLLERLQSNIVSSPQRIRNDIASDEKQLKDCEQRFSQTIQDIRKWDRDVQSHAINSQQIDTFLLELKSIERKQDELITMIQSRTERTKSLSGHGERLNLLSKEIEDMKLKNASELRQMDDKCKKNDKQKDIILQEKDHLEKDTKIVLERLEKDKIEYREQQADYKMGEQMYLECLRTYDDAVLKLKERFQTIKENITAHKAEVHDLIAEAQNYINENKND